MQVPLHVEAMDALPANFNRFRDEIGAGLGLLYGPDADRYFRERARQALTEQLHQDDMLAWAATAPGGDPLGMLFVALDGRLARVTLLHVLADCHDDMAACRLMVHAAEALRATGADIILYDTASATSYQLEPLALHYGFIACPRRLMRMAAADWRAADTRDIKSTAMTPDHLDAAASCMVQAYTNHPDQTLYRELRCEVESCLFLQRVMAGAYGQTGPSWMRAVWDGPRCIAAIVVCHALPQTFFVLQLFTHPAYRGQGLATMLLQEVAREAHQAMPNALLLLGVSDANPARALYSRLGFKSIKKVKAYVWHRHGATSNASPLPCRHG